MLTGAASSRRSRIELALKAFLVASFLGVLVAGAVRLTERERTSQAHRVELGRWTVLDRPAWSTLDDVRAIRTASGLAAHHAGWYDPSLETLDGRLARSPTVRRVAQVRREWPNRIEAVVELRRPLVAVRVSGPRGESWVQADEDGVALAAPTPTRPCRDGRPLRAVTGAVGSAPAPGRSFPADVRAAASLASWLEEFSDDRGREAIAWLDRIDVANYAGRVKPGASEITLQASPPAPGAPAGSATASHCVVEWGRAGDRDEPGSEMPFDAKARHLYRALRLFPGLQGLKAVRVAFADLVVVPETPGPAHLLRALESDVRASAR